MFGKDVLSIIPLFLFLVGISGPESHVKNSVSLSLMLQPKEAERTFWKSSGVFLFRNLSTQGRRGAAAGTGYCDSRVEQFKGKHEL